MSTTFLGFEPLSPAIQQPKTRAAANRDPQRAELVRTLLAQLQPNQAAVVACPDAAELQTLRCTALVYGKRQIATRAQGLTLHIFHKPARPSQPALF